MRDTHTWRTQRLYRDPRHGMLMGVCAGLADYLGCNVTLTRILAIVALLWFNVFTLIAYLALGVVLPTKPDHLHEWGHDEIPWRNVRRSASGTFRDTRQRFREIHGRLQRLERYVTSGQYDLDREFRDLEEDQEPK